jgi:primosomal protein N' (replication factor Y)
VKVLLPLKLAAALDYALPGGMVAPAGSLVQVPLQGRTATGVVWDAKVDGAVPADRLRAVQAVLPAPALREGLRRTIDWVAAYSMCAPGEVLAMAIRAYAPPLTDRPGRLLCRGNPPPPGSSRSRLAAWRAAARPVAPAALAAAAGASRSLLRAMRRDGQLRTVATAAIDGAIPAPSGQPCTVLAPAQAVAAADLCASVATLGYSATLLQGVTGSGKTEVYFEAIRACLGTGRQSLVLLPEIALSAQWLRRFHEAFGLHALPWHSGLSARARQATWRAAAEHDAQVVVGARSALFLPFASLGLIVVDEEHDSSYKQEDGVVYNARDIAVLRARMEGATVVLVSATPSLESLTNVDAGRYRRVTLPDRAGGAALPDVATVDLRAAPPPRGRFLSPVTVAAVAESLRRGEQALLFLNRRGYAPLTLCRHCGHRFACKQCTTWLVEHRARRSLLCHYCGFTIPAPTVCPACGVPDTLAAVGPGVERITEEAGLLFPSARILPMTSDTLSSPGKAAAAAASIENREVDLVVGTQIIAKGWHFPHLTLVGVVDADLGLSGGDLRAGERMMQLLHQVAGRAGRAQAPGRVLLQTFQPDHAVMRALAAADFEGFMRAESRERQHGAWPPYTRLAAVIVSAATDWEADAVARALGRSAPGGAGITVFGPAPAPLALLRGRHRRRLLLRTRRDIRIQDVLRSWLARVTLPRHVRVTIDIDPMSFL